MRLPFLASLLAAASLAVAAPPGAERRDADRPAEPAGIAVFTRHARFVDAKISPKGNYLAVISTERGRRSLVFLDLAARQVVWALRPDAEDMVWSFDWVTDRRVVASVVGTEGYLAGPVNRGELYAVDADGRNGRMIFGYRAGEMQTGSHIRKAERRLEWAEVIDPRAGTPGQVLIATRSWRDAGDRVVSVLRLDARTGVATPVTVSPIAESGFITDEKGEPRIAVGRDQEWRRRVFHREPAGTWAEVTNLPGLGPRASPVGFAAGDRTLYLVDDAPGGFGLYGIGLGGGERRLLAKSEMAPFHGFVEDRATGRIVAAESEPDLPTLQFLDATHPYSRALQGLLAAHPDDHVCFLNATDDGKRMVVKVYSDRKPGQFLLVDVEKMTAEPIVEARPWIEPAAMAEKTAFHTKAGDGLWIHGYVTLPPNRPSGMQPPLVVLPHGGPHAVRDHWGFDPEAQLLASRGFAVLQVNYRGSGGYGEAYQDAGFGKWGSRMIEDIVDATRYAIRKGWADPKRICAYGASYGGYAAMQAAILAPDLFRCAAGYAGVYDLKLLGEGEDLVYSRLGRAFVRKAVGRDDAQLDAASPAKNAEKLKAKVLLIHGKEDRRAPIDHAEALRKALIAQGRSPEWYVEPKEGHGFYDEGARERMYTRLLAFLEENTRPEPVAR